MRLDWRGTLGLALSAILLWWTLKDVHIADVWAVLRHSNLLYFAGSTAAATLIFPVRARRWRTILDPLAPKLPFGALWRATAIGMMVNNLVPARAGEIARAYALSRETKRVSFAAAFASLAVDRLFDAVVLLPLMFGAMLDPAFPSGATIHGQSMVQIARGGILFVIVVLIGLYAVVFFPARLISIYELLARRIAPRLEARGRDALVAFAGGLGVLRSPRRFAAVYLWALAHWLLHALGLWLAFRAVGITAPFSAALFLQGLLGFAVAIPSSPGFFGVFEGAARVGLGVYGVPATLAVSWAIGYHVLSFIPITLIGLYYFARLGLHFRDMRSAATDAPAKPNSDAIAG
jgi:uncharacterized protein (TIRG00374 family)